MAKISSAVSEGAEGWVDMIVSISPKLIDGHIIPGTEAVAVSVTVAVTVADNSKQ